MKRLTDEILAPPNKFNQCQLCGREGDICSFQMHQECSEDDKPEKDRYLIICREGNCYQRLLDHERLYKHVPWGMGQAGALMLLCSDCPSRKNFSCAHPDLKANGGPGLLVNLANPLGILHMSWHGESPGPQWPTPATACEGHPTKKPTKDTSEVNK